MSPSPEKEMHKLKVENYVSFSGLTEDLSLGCSLSDSSEDCSEEVREAEKKPMW